MCVWLVMFGTKIRLYLIMYKPMSRNIARGGKKKAIRAASVSLRHPAGSPTGSPPPRPAQGGRLAGWTSRLTGKTGRLTGISVTATGATGRLTGFAARAWPCTRQGAADRRTPTRRRTQGFADAGSKPGAHVPLRAKRVKATLKVVKLRRKIVTLPCGNA